MPKRSSVVNYSSSAADRQPSPELPDHELPIAPRSEGALQESEISVAYLRLLWQHRRLLARVALSGLLASAFIAFLIPTRYESIARLMPPDNSQSSGLAMAAAALSGAAGGLGTGAPGGLSGVASELLGMKSTSDVFVGILASRTV